MCSPLIECTLDSVHRTSIATITLIYGTLLATLHFSHLFIYYIHIQIVVGNVNRLKLKEFSIKLYAEEPYALDGRGMARTLRELHHFLSVNRKNSHHH